MKVIIPVAGLGTRLMPLTMHQPKAMVGIADKPMIDYAIREMIDAGVNEAVFVLSPNQLQLRRYVESVNFGIKTHFAIQKEPIGNADAIFKARPFLDGDPVGVIFSDDVLTHGSSVLGEALALSEKTASPVLILERVPKEMVSRYGIVDAGRSARGEGKSKVYEIARVIEKPSPDKAPSNLAVIGRYVLTPRVFEYIQKLYVRKAGSRPIPGNGEIGITDALTLYLEDGGKVYGLELQGARFDCGSKLGLMKAQAHFALAHPEFGPKLKGYLKSILES